MASKLLATVQIFLSAVRGQVAHLAEASVFRAVEGYPWVLRAVDGGANDGGIYVGRQALGSSLISRILGLSDLQEAQVVPFEIKNWAPCTDTWGGVFWRISFSERQLESCQFVIITSAQDCSYVALLPMHLWLERVNTHGLGAVSDAIRPLWTIHPLPAFPPEMAPFMLPLSQLGEALDGVRDFANGFVDHWSVPRSSSEVRCR